VRYATLPPLRAGSAALRSHLAFLSCGSPAFQEEGVRSKGTERRKGTERSKGAPSS
jgi:hypothetical protein